MIKHEDITRVGKFQKTHGLKGELNTILDIDPEYFEEGKPLIVAIEGLFVPFYIESIRKKGNVSYLIKLEGVNNEKDASRFVNQDVFMLSADKEKWLDEDEFYVDSFIGYDILNRENNKSVGEIIDIDDSTENVLFIVKQKDSEETVFIPVVDDFIVEVNEADKKIVMELPEGLIDLNLKGKGEEE